MNKKKILILNYEFPPVGAGGGVMAYYLAKSYIKKNFQVTVITSHWGDLKLCEQLDGINIIRIPVFRKKIMQCSIIEMFYYFILTIRPLLRFCKKQRPDIIHSFFLVPSAPLAYIVKLFYKIPYIITLEGGDVPGFEPRVDIYFKFLNPILNLILKNAERVVSVSNGLKNLALKSFPDIDIIVVPNGISINEYFSESEKRNFKTTNFVFIGRLVEQKNLFAILNAVKILKNKNLDFLISIIGMGPLEPILKKYVLENNLEKYVLFFGWKSKDEIKKILSNSHCLVMPSFIEGFSLTIIEAMASSNALILSRTSGNEEIIRNGENGYLIELGSDIQDIVKYIELLTKNRKQCINMGLVNREKVKEYDLEVVVLKYIDIFEKIK